MVKHTFLDRLLTIFLCICAVFVISPVILITILSFSDGVQVYIDFYLWNPQYVNSLTNSLICAGSVALGSVIVSIFAAYVFAKVKFKGRDILFYLYIIVMMMPFQVTLLPQYIVSRNIGIYDTLLSIILPGIFSPFPVFLLTQIMKSLPDEMLEAARLDTGSTVRILKDIVIPAIRPGIICAWALTFTETWNMVAEPLVMMETEARYPIAVMLSKIEVGDILGFAATAIFLLLPFLIFTFFEEEILEGLGEYRLK